MSSSRLACSGLLSAEPCPEEDGDKEARSAFDFGAQIAATSSAKIHLTFALPPVLVGGRGAGAITTVGSL